jgi:hypothetical protein
LSHTLSETLASMPKIIDYDAQHSQASRIIAKFGSAANLSKALKQVGCPRSPATISRWTYPCGRYEGTGTTGGLIPTRVLPAILKAARLWGIIITDQELRP